MSGDLSRFVDLLGGYVALAAVLALLLLIGLYVSQRRDLNRLRGWMESDPGHPSRDLLASEAILDRAEAELAELEADGRTEPISPTSPRIPGDRPTLSRLTMEREALKPHPRWRRFVGRATETRVLVALGIIAIVLGLAAILASEKLLEFGDDGSTGGGPPDAGEIEVAVLNGSNTSGAAEPVSERIGRRGFDVGRVAVAPEPSDADRVLFVDDARREAQRVAQALGIDEVERADRASEREGRSADVVVIVGEDGAGP